MSTPLILLTLAYIAGLVFGHGFLYFPYTIVTIVFLGTTASIVIALTKRIVFRNSLIVMAACLAGMAAYLYSAAWLPTDHFVRVFPPDGTSREITGTVISPLDRDPDRTAFVVGISSIDGRSVSGRLRVSIREAVTSIGYGDTIRFTAKPYEPRDFRNPGGFDYAAYLARNGIHAVAGMKSADAVEIIRHGSGMFRTVLNWRERIRQAFLRGTSGQGSAILQAMTLGEEGGLTDETRDRFMAAGVTHIISISGSHLGMAAVLCFGLIRSLLFLLPEPVYHRLTLRTDPRVIAAWITLPVVIFYTLLAGGQVATIRSLIMISAGMAALILNRENALIHALALAALGILVAQPQAIFDISFQLSFVSVLIIGHVVSLWNELPFRSGTGFRKLGSQALLLVIISVSTAIATGPLVAHYFNQISLIGVVSNLIVIPFAGMLVVPLGLVSGLLSLFTGALPFASLNQAVADAFIGMVALFARFPLAEFHPPAPGITWMAACTVLALSLTSLLWSWLRWKFKPFEASFRLPRISVYLSAGAGLALIAMTIPHFMQNDRVRVSFIDVGQGDCSLIELPGGKNILIDGGGSFENRFDIGRRVLEPFFRNKGINRFDLVILSHPHPDHVNGILSIMKRFAVNELWTSGRDRDLPEYSSLMDIAGMKRINHRIMTAETPPVALGEAELSIVSPAESWQGHSRKAYAGENNRSLVVRLKVQDRVYLFTGDAGSEAEHVMVEFHNMKADVIKVPHHGSKSSSSEAFVGAVQPTIAVISVGLRNPYHHPSDDVVDRYRDAGARIYRTDHDGLTEISDFSSGLAVMTQEQRMLKQIRLQSRNEWLDRELANWERLSLRTMAF